MVFLFFIFTGVVKNFRQQLTSLFLVSVPPRKEYLSVIKRFLNEHLCGSKFFYLIIHDTSLQFYRSCLYDSCDSPTFISLGAQRILGDEQGQCHCYALCPISGAFTEALEAFTATSGGSEGQEH